MSLNVVKTLMVAVCCALSVAHAQAQPDLAEAEFNRIFNCDWIMQSEQERSAAQTATVLAYSKLQFINDSRNFSVYKKSFRALGTLFDSLSVAGSEGGAYLSLQGAQASLEAILKHFAAQNLPFALAIGADAPTQSGMRRWMRTEVGPDNTLVLIVQEGVGEFEDDKRTPGASAYCVVGETSAKDAQALGLEPIFEVQRVIDTNVAKSPAWGNAIIASGSKRRTRILASYTCSHPTRSAAYLRFVTTL